MKTFSSIPHLCLVWMLFIATLDLAIGQTQPQVGTETVQIAGKIEAFAGNQLKLRGEGNQESLIVFNPQVATFQYVSDTDLALLTSGMLVRFETPMEADGSVKQPLAQLEILYFNNMRGLSREEALSYMPGIFPVTAEGPKDRKAKKDQAAVAGNQPFRVVGQVMGVQGQVLQVAAGNRTVLVTVEPSATAKVLSNETSFCRIGDDAVVEGVKYPGQGDVIQATSVKVTAAKPMDAKDQAKLASPKGAGKQKKSKAPQPKPDK